MLRTPVGDTRQRILVWLREPGRSERGVTADAVATHFGLPLPVAATHLRLLASLGVLRTAGVLDRLRYRRDEVRIAEVCRMLEKGW